MTPRTPAAANGTPKEAGKLGLSGWVLFDWATQPFYTLVLTFLFAPYFVNGFMDDPVWGQAVWGYTIGVAELIAALLAPVLGAIADAGQPRKPWIAALSVLLVVGLCGLWFAIPGAQSMLPVVVISFGVAAIGAELATVFNNAMMPSLVRPNRLGRLSGIGWATGYVGGLVSLVLVAGFVIASPDTGRTLLGLEPVLGLDHATREGDRLVGPFSALWYVVFVLPLFLFTPDRPVGAKAAHPVKAGLALLAETAKELRRHANIVWFLIARMLYVDGLAAIFAFGGIYAASVFDWGATELGLFGIVLTLTGTIGAAFGGVLDDRFGSKRVIVAALLLFIVAALGVLSVDREHVLFVLPVEPKEAGSAAFSSTGELVYLAFAMLIGIAAGPMQSASRTLLARLSPPDKMTEFFGFFAFSGKITAFTAPLVIAAVTQLSGSQRAGIASTLAFLIGGLLLMQKVKQPR